MLFIKKLWEDEEKRTIILLVISGLALLLSFFKIFSTPIDLAWIAIIICGIPIIKTATVELVTKFNIKADVLVSMALVAAVIIGEIFAAGEVAFIMTLGALLEERTVSKARTGIEKLVHLTPTIARIIKDGTELILPAKEVLLGDIIRVFPGETIAVDGILISGQTAVDQSIMTGESMPIDKIEGDEVFGGTVNQFGSFDMVTTKIGEDSSLQRMIRLVESADASKAKIVGMADRWATWIVVIALTTAVITWFATGEIIRSVTILVVFCPCALVLATPTAIMAGIGNATKYGILIREGDALERLAKIKKLTFDKTGTLTYGKPSVTKVKCFDDSMSEDEFLTLITCVEKRSEHPLGKSIVQYFHSVSKSELIDVVNFKMIMGKGVSCNVDNHKLLAGNQELLKENNVMIPNHQIQVALEYINKGSTVVYVAYDNEVKGFVVLEDVIRESARSIIQDIEGMGIRCVLLTGDNQMTAASVATSAGINEVYAECLPEDKLLTIDRFQNNHEPVCMVGDGVNDAPALKKAFVGIAMGGIGSDIAVDAADIVLISDDIKCIPHLLELSAKTMKTIHINLILSMTLNFVAVILAITGVLNPIVGAMVHNVGSVVVIIHSALLLKWKKK